MCVKAPRGADPRTSGARGGAGALGPSGSGGTGGAGRSGTRAGDATQRSCTRSTSGTTGRLDGRSWARCTPGSRSRWGNFRHAELHTEEVFQLLERRGGQLLRDQRRPPALHPPRERPAGVYVRSPRGPDSEHLYAGSYLRRRPALVGRPHRGSGGGGAGGAHEGVRISTKNDGDGHAVRNTWRADSSCVRLITADRRGQVQRGCPAAGPTGSVRGEHPDNTGGPARSTSAPPAGATTTGSTCSTRRARRAPARPLPAGVQDGGVERQLLPLARDATFAGWRRRLPAGFALSVKAPRGLTHARKLSSPRCGCRGSTRGCTNSGIARGVLLVQLPPALERDDARLRLLPGRGARGGSGSPWSSVTRAGMDEEVFAVLERHGAAYCVMSGARAAVRAAGDRAVRVRAAARPRPRPALRRLLQRRGPPLVGRPASASGQARGRDVYAYFNNDGGGHAVRNARTLRDLVGGEFPGRPPRRGLVAAVRASPRRCPRSRARGSPR